MRSAFQHQVVVVKRTAAMNGCLNSPGLTTIARRVQSDVLERTGHYYPLHQVLASIHDINTEREFHCEGFFARLLLCASTPRCVCSRLGMDAECFSPRPCARSRSLQLHTHPFIHVHDPSFYAIQVCTKLFMIISSIACKPTTI